MHTVKFWDTRLYRLQTVADRVGYHIDSDADYLQICKLLPVSRSKPAPCKAVRTTRRALYNMHKRNGLVLYNLHKFKLFRPFSFFYKLVKVL